MSYTPTTWQTGDTITAEKLNNMNAFVVNCTDTTIEGESAIVCDKNGEDVLAAAQSGPVVFLRSYQNDEFYEVLPLMRITAETITESGNTSISYCASTWTYEFRADGNNNLSMVNEK